VELVEGVALDVDGAGEEEAAELDEEESLVDEVAGLSEDFVEGLSVDILESEEESPALEPESLELEEESADLESEEESLELLGA
jgi:hypothetical protein